jgi:hypothetical protein
MLRRFGEDDVLLRHHVYWSVSFILAIRICKVITRAAAPRRLARASVFLVV